jgi:hypothetical protein
MKNNEIKLNIGIDTSELNAAMRSLKGTLLSIDVSEAFRKLEQERESQRWATDPLELGYKGRNGARRVRSAVASVFWGVARLCDRCSEILEE